jgi:RNA polymerase sigma-70 factor (ECF subfamily)
MNDDLVTADLELVGKVLGGDKKSFSLLVRRHQSGLLRLSLRFVKDIDVAEDVVQESFIKAYERLASFEGRASFKSWLYQIAVNTAKNKIRSRRDEVRDLDEVHLGVAAKAESGLVHQAVSHLIAKYVEELPFKQRTALTLRIYEDLSFKEIAEIMDCPYDTAKANYRHALLKLREEMQGHDDLQNWSEEVGGFFMEWNHKVTEAEA